MTKINKNRYFFNQRLTPQEVRERLYGVEYTIKFKDDFKPKSIKEIVDKVFISGNDYQLNNTIKVHASGKETEQCIGATRSIEDVYLLCKHYLPDVTMKDVTKHFLNESSIGCYGKCYTHNKYMFRKTIYYGSDLKKRIINKFFTWDEK